MYSSDAQGLMVSSLLLEPRTMTFRGLSLPVSYLSFACTLPRYRGMGAMRELLARALLEAHSAGRVAVALLPAQPWLQYYYQRAGGWANTVYTLDHCYTSAHRFNPGNYVEAADATPAEIWEAVERLEPAQGPCVVLHTRQAWDMMVHDLRLSGGRLIAVRHMTSRRVAALAAALPGFAPGVVTVKGLMGDDDAACEAALAAASAAWPGSQIMVKRAAPQQMTGGGIHHLSAAGMMRISHVQDALYAAARTAPASCRKLVTVTDPIIPGNCGTWLLEGGCGAERVDPVRGRALKLEPYDVLDVSVDVLARLLFSSEPVAAMTGFPGVRPVMNLLLE